MDAEKTPRRFADLQFRVLVIGRANAGKTSILQRVCETTESPTIYRGNKEVRDPNFCRGEHCIDDALVFSNHEGYVFHDSQGIEAGDEEKLKTLKEFIQRKCGEKKLRDKLHAIWYCVPMDGHRPWLDLRFYENICLDQSVPVIAVFTKYDQFLFNVEMDVSDDPDKYPVGTVAQIAEKRFQDYYLRPLGDDVKYVQLEKMHMRDSRCDNLVEKTAEALNEDAVALMLLAVQKGNLELSVKMALSRCSVRRLVEFNIKDVIRECLIPFPYIWAMLHILHCKLFINNTCQNYQQPPFNHWYFFHFIMFTLYLTVMKAVILILKHATLLCLSNKPEAALTRVGLNYQEANIDLKIQEHLKAVPPEDFVEQFAGFINVTEIGLFILPSITTLSHQVPVSPQSSVETGA
ncbi:hypothetical protein V8E53_013099 [Lactarius tabidus]